MTPRFDAVLCNHPDPLRSDLSRGTLQCHSRGRTARLPQDAERILKQLSQPESLPVAPKFWKNKACRLLKKAGMGHNRRLYPFTPCKWKSTHVGR